MTIFLRLSILILTLGVAFSSEHDSTPLPFPTPAEVKKLVPETPKTPETPNNIHDKAKTEHPHWSYKGDESPEHWGELNEEYAVCQRGKMQSPINFTLSNVDHSISDNHLDKASFAKHPPLKFAYQDDQYNVKDNGHTIIFENLSQKSHVIINDHVFKVLQFHAHHPSEHTFNKQEYPLELHIVHQNKEGALVVVGIMVEEGENPAVEKLWNVLEKEIEAETTFNVSQLLPKQTKWFHYQGSLTTPPCTEHVDWHVAQTPIQMTEEDIQSFVKLYQDNHRPAIEPTPDRVIEIEE